MTAESGSFVRHIVETLSRLEGRDMLDLDPLYDAVDVDALDDLLLRSDSDVSVSFVTNGWFVTVDGRGQSAIATFEKE